MTAGDVCDSPAGAMEPRVCGNIAYKDWLLSRVEAETPPSRGLQSRRGWAPQATVWGQRAEWGDGGLVRTSL